MAGAGKLQRSPGSSGRLEGDISQPLLGLNEDAFRHAASRTDEVWHCAASLSFTDEERDEIFGMNVGGTQKNSGSGATDAVATAASRQHGVRCRHEGIRDGIGDQTGQTFRNAYEASKCEAELLVADTHARKASSTSTIYRPSIVIGDSITGRATHFHGVYAFIRGLFTGAERLRRKAASNGQVHLPVRVLGKIPRRR